MTKRILGTSIDFPKVMTLVFLAVALLLALSHETWRDELQPWLIAKHSSSVLELFQNMRYEGHALMWPLGLFAVTRFSDQPGAMQILHLLFAVSAMYVVLRFSPFTRLQKMLFVFGYFSIYEYCVVCRPYVLAALLVYCFCALFRPSRGKNVIALAVILFLLCQTSVYGVLLALSLGFMVLFESVYDGRRRAVLPRSKRVMVVAVAIVVVGVVGAGLTLKPPADSGFSPNWHFGYEAARLSATAKTVWRAFAPIPEIRHDFWDTNIVTAAGLQYILSAVLLLFFIFVFLDRPVVLSLYCSGTFAFLVFTYLKYMGRIRHHGHLFILLVACLWLASRYPAKTLRPSLFGRLAGFASTHKAKVIVLVLLAQVVAAAVAGGVDLTYPFSASKEVAEFLKANSMDEMLIVGDKDFAAMGVSGHLGKEIYYPRAGRMGTYVVYDEQRRYMRPHEVFRTARHLADERRQDVLILLNYDPGEITYKVTKIREFTRSVVESERFNLYIMKYREGGTR